MTEAPLDALLGFGAALLAALLLMPAFVWLGGRFGLTVNPRLFGGLSRIPITYLGGLGLVLSSLAGLAIAGVEREIGAVLVGGLAVFAVGLVDDRLAPHGLSPAVRFIIQVSAALFTWQFAFSGSGTALEAFFTVLLLVGAANAFNLLDNMDGVAGSTALGTAAGLVLVGLMTGRVEVVGLAAAVAGSSIGFLRHNLIRSKAYLGDGGALFIGFVLGGLALKASVGFRPGWAMVAVVALLAVAAADGWVATLSRFLNGRPILAGGMDHISHRLVKAGLSSPTVAVAHGLAALLATGVVAFASQSDPTIMVFLIALYAAVGTGLLTVRVYGDVPANWGRRITAILGMGVLGAVLLAVAPVISAASHLKDARDAFVKAASVTDDPAEAGRWLTEAQSLSALASREAKSRLTFPARGIPVVRANIRALDALAEGSRAFSLASIDGVDLMANLRSKTTGVGLVRGSIDLELWRETSPQIDRAHRLAEGGLKGVQRSGGLLAPPLADARTAFLEQGGQTLTALTKSKQAAHLVPILFGSEAPRTWFLAIQNPVESRATGGFLGAFGILKANEGNLRLERLESNLSLPEIKNSPPASAEYVERYERFDTRRSWQNVNMTPDFPTAARMMAEMWEGSTGEQIDGVIGVDANGLNELLRIVGPIEVPEFGQISSENFLPLALNQAYVRFPEKAARVDFLLSVGRGVWTRVLSGEFNDLRLLADPVNDAVNGRHLQVWIPGEERSTRALGIAGELRRPASGDFLLVIVQNAAANKVDYYARRAVTYKVNIDESGKRTGKVGVSLKNETPDTGLPPYIVGPYLPTDTAGLNRTYLSVYTSKDTGVLGAKLNGKDVGVESHAELGLSVVSSFIEILPQQEVSLKALLDGGSRNSNVYRLRVQRQPTLQPDDFRLEVTLPEGVSVKNKSPGMRVEGRRVLWTGPLDSDKDFFIRFEKPPLQGLLAKIKGL